MKIRVIPLLVILFAIPLVYGFDAYEGYPQLPDRVIVNPSCEVYTGANLTLIICPESVLLTLLEITINTTAYNGLLVMRGDNKIIVEFYYQENLDPEVATYIGLPFPSEYNGTMVYGWEWDIAYYFPPENKVYYNYNERAIAKPGYHFDGTGMVRHPDMRPFYFKIKAITDRPIVEVPSPSENWSPPPWWDILGWISYLLRLLGIFVQGLGTAIYTVALMISQLIALTPYLLFIIPLHIVASFIHSPIDGIKTIKLYLELGRKLYDLFIKVVQAIAQFIQAVKPV